MLKEAQFKQKGRSIFSKKVLGRGVLIFFAVLVLISLVFAVTNTINSFNSQTNPFEINFTEAGNKTVYIDVPRYAYVENLTLEVGGIEVS